MKKIIVFYSLFKQNEGQTDRSDKSGLGITTLTGFTSTKDVTNYTCVVKNEHESRFSSSSLLFYRQNYLVYVYVLSAIITGIMGVWSVRWMVSILNVSRQMSICYIKCYVKYFTDTT